MSAGSDGVAGEGSPRHRTGRRSSRTLRVQVCDGCCCGTVRKHPGVDHDLIRQRLADAARAAGGSSRVVGCVDECSRSNVVVVRPAGVAAERLWIGGILASDVVDALCDWLEQGAPSPVPGRLADHVFRRSATGAQAPVPTPVSLKAAQDG